MKTVFMKMKTAIWGLVMASALLVGTCGTTTLQVHAAEVDEIEVLKADLVLNPEIESQKHTRTMMTDCIISVSCSAEGMQIGITTGAVGTASVIGIKDIVVMKKVWYGWKTVAVGESVEDYNRTIVGAGFLYANAEYDETYRITCVHYADVDGYTEVQNDTGGIVFTY